MRNIFFFSLLIIVCHTASAQNDTVKDIDGNVYKTVKIGSQLWMAENLKTTHYRDGSPIRGLELGSLWRSAGESNIGGWCYYKNDSGNNPTYGKLYNWYAVTDTRLLCPTGWHVPSDHEWTVLIDYLGGDTVAGGKMKATTIWNHPNIGADNSSGFTALPSGVRSNDGAFYFFHCEGYFWTSAKLDSEFYRNWYSKSRYLDYSSSEVHRSYLDRGGLSVRCIGD